MQFFLTAILAAASAVSASPLSRNYAQQHSRNVVTTSPISDVVVAPAFIAPTGGESYKIGTNQTASWDTSKIDEEAKDYTGVLYLGYADGDSSDEHLDVAHPLAYGFKLIDGTVNYTVPSNATARPNYFLVLVGDSGNVSPKFSITA
ncbi:hypothetical protein PENSPDRAFT_626973 [Peniophora sp. CONT]|nr:hypothetical protein PENSPDRAFT_626973 [Peniophora sp. CONT]